MRIMILGGDGFCGWPTSLRFSNLGHDVCIVDNFARRKIDIELGVESLTPIKTMSTRLDTWEKISGKKIDFFDIDIAMDYDGLKQAIIDFQPCTIVNFAEQRAAPYSMKSPQHKHYTIANNLGCNCNLLSSIAELKADIHVIHLGTMGVYGYGTANMEIPEGYLNVRINGTGTPQEILYPANPGSIYHLTKCQDQLMFAFFAKNDGIRITDLHQGIVWGTDTAETKMHEDLINRFDYDGDFGTVLNRFIVQSQVDYPLSIYGSGGQTRAFININDTVSCIELIANNPNQDRLKVKVANQMTETQTVLDIAELVAALTGAEIAHVENPRNESDSNDLFVSNKTLLDLGLNPKFIKDGLVNEVALIAKNYMSRIDVSKIPCLSNWS